LNEKLTDEEEGLVTKLIQFLDENVIKEHQIDILQKTIKFIRGK